MNSSNRTPTKKKKVARTPERIIPYSSPMPKQRKAASAPKMTPTSRKARSDTDFAPQKQAHSPLPPLNPRFERPNTRAHSSSDAGSDIPDPEDVLSEVPSPAIEDTAPVAEETALVIEIHPQEQESADMQVEANDPPEENFDEPAGKHQDTNVDNQPAEQTETSATAVPTTFFDIQDKYVKEATPAITEETNEEPEPMDDIDELPKTIENSIPIPAQIAIVAASPSKRVAFSPNKQESVLSVPGKMTKAQSTLRGILKPTPFRLEGTTGENPSATAETSSSHHLETADALEDFVKNTIVDLESSDLQVRTAAYSSLQATLRVSAENMQPVAVRKTLKMFIACNQRDIDLSNPPTLVQVALKCLGYYLFHTGIVTMFPGKDLETYLTTILSIVETTTDKATCQLAVWILSTSRIPAKHMAPFVPKMIQTFSDNLDSRFKSNSIMIECLIGLFSILGQHQNEIVPTVQVWFIPLISRLVYNIPGIRSKALDTLIAVTPKLIEKEDPRRQQAVADFLTHHCVDFFASLTQNFLNTGEEVYAITVWGALVTVIGRPLQRTVHFNPLLKMAEKCFNTSSSRRAEIKMAAFQAWTRLIYNFAIGGHIAQDKPLKLMLTPIVNCFMNEKVKRVRLACTLTWIALIYSLGPKLPKFSSQALFPLLKIVVQDESEHIRDVGLRFVNALFSNAGGQELVEGRWCIVPGTISFTDLGLSDATWVRSELLDCGLECLFDTIMLQHKNVRRDEWRLSGLTGLPLLILPCAKLWENILRTVRDINLNERGLKPTAEAEKSISKLVYFIEKISQCDPNMLASENWPASDPKGVNLLKNNPEKVGYIMRADVVHFLYNCMIEIFSVRSLVATRYKVEDSLHTALERVFKKSQLDTHPSEEESVSVMISPLEFILKCWLATCESVIGTPYETSFWQAVSSLVDMSKSGLNILAALYKCLSHMEDIKRKRLTTDASIWSPPNAPVEPLVFQEFQFKHWSIIAQRLGTTINEINEISDDVAPGDLGGYDELYDLLLYPFGALRDPRKPSRKDSLENMELRERIAGTQDDEMDEVRIQFMEKFKLICLPTWSDLVRVFYKVAQHKRGNANAAMNNLALRIRVWSDPDVPFMWTQSMSIACASVIVDTIVFTTNNSTAQLTRGHSSKQNVDELLNLCSNLFEQAYNNLQRTQMQDGPGVPPIVEAAFLLMEKIINKAQLPSVMLWLHQMQGPILTWMNDSESTIAGYPKATRRSLQSRVENFWNNCVLPKLLLCSTNPTTGGNSTVGSVIAPHLSTVRGALQQAQSGSPAGTSRSSPALVEQHPNPFNSMSLVLLQSLMAAGLGSESKSIVNKTLEFWNDTFGSSDGNIEYPDEMVAVLRPLKLVATIKLPGWSLEDDSQVMIPEFASLSQEMLSIPAELNIRTGLSIRLKRKADTAPEVTPANQKRKPSPPVLGAGNSTSVMASTAAAAVSSSGIVPVSSTPGSNRSSRSSTPAVDSDSSAQSSPAESKHSRKKRRRRAEQAALENLRRHQEAGAAVAAVTISDSTPETSLEQAEIQGKPSKKNKLVKVKREELPPAPLFKRGPPLQPYDPANDPEASQLASRGGGEIGSGLDTAAIESASASSVEDNGDTGDSPKYVTQESNVIQGQSAPKKKTAQREEPMPLATMDKATDAGSTPGVSNDPQPANPPKSPMDNSSRGRNGSMGLTGSHPQTLSGAYYTPRSDGSIQGSQINSTPAGSPTSSSTPTTVMASITTGDAFLDTVRQLVKSREFVSTMDMRQLVEFQSQLNTLNQTICTTWGQLVTGGGNGPNGPPPAPAPPPTEQ